MTGPYFSTSTGCRALMELHPDLRDEPFMNTDGKRRKLVPSAPKRYRLPAVCSAMVLSTVTIWLSVGYYLEIIKP